MPYEKIGNNDPVCIADEVPFDIPESWEWVRLELLATKEIKRGKSPKYAEDSSVLVFAQKCNVKTGGINMTLAKKLEPMVFDKYPIDEYLQDKDIIINSTGNGTLGRIGLFQDSDRINDNIIVPDSHVTVLRSSKNICDLYLFYVLKYYQPYLEKLGEGSTNQTELKPITISNLFIPVPPYKEQERIVEKIRLVFPLTDSYGEKENELEKYNLEFPSLLKKSILQMAIQGKLVEQNPSDEPAEILLQAIKAEKDALIKAGKIKKDKNESIIYRRDNSYYEKIGSEERCIDDEIPFDIPESWEWCRLSQLIVKDIKRGKSPKYSESGKVYVFAQKCNEKTGGINVKLAKHLDMSVFDKYPENEYIIDKDIVINSTGNGTLGRIGIFRDSDRIDDCILVPDSHVTVVRINPLLCIEYIFSVLKSYQPFLEGLGEGSTNQTELKPISISNLLIPIPPHQEQNRITQKLEVALELNRNLRIDNVTNQ